MTGIDEENDNVFTKRMLPQYDDEEEVAKQKRKRITLAQSDDKIGI